MLAAVDSAIKQSPPDRGAGADPNFEPFLAHPIATAEAMVYRNCVVPMELCHHFAPAMVHGQRLRV